MKLFAKAVYSDSIVGIYQEPCTQDGFNKLYEKGLEIKSNNPEANYEIGVFTENYRLFWSINSFPLKVAKNYLSENFEEYAQEELKSFLSDDFQNDKLEIDFARKKQYEWDKIPEFADKKKKEYEIWGRLGISLSVTQDQLEILRGDKNKATELLIELIQSDKCKMNGDTYFPELIYNNYLDLDFDLPETPIHRDSVIEIKSQRKSIKNSLDSKITDAKERVGNSSMTFADDDFVK